MENSKNIIERPPVVVVMGHVDHGKSSILEAIKDFKITKKEAGGITQHIGAYEIEHKSKKITFLDTPGHEAFSAMRSRGARVADITVLVVAADDGVKTQTKEAIAHAKKAGTPIIVAINKIDKPEADSNRVIQELSAEEVYLESIGGEIPSVLVSAKTKENIGDLIEMILLMAEMESLQADMSLAPSGIIVESHLDHLKGPTTTIIVENGVLKKGDIVTTRSVLGRIKKIEDFQGNPIEEVTPSMPAIVYGFEDIPMVGDEFRSFDNTSLAKEFIKEKSLEKVDKNKDINPDAEVVNVIFKADFLGSLEAIEGMIAEIPQERMAVKIIKSEIGNINESDIILAKSSNAIIFGFRVKVASQAKAIVERDKVVVLVFDVIYEFIEKIRKVMERAITPRIERIELGKAKVLALFFDGKGHQIVGCKIIQGEVKRGAEIEILRSNSETEEEEKVGKGRAKGIKRGTKDVEKIDQGEECGISYEGSIKVEEGDTLQFYLMETEKIEGI